MSVSVAIKPEDYDAEEQALHDRAKAYFEARGHVCGTGYGVVSGCGPNSDYTAMAYTRFAGGLCDNCDQILDIHQYKEDGLWVDVGEEYMRDVEKRPCAGYPVSDIEWMLFWK